MLSIFPQILYLGPAGITIIRVAAGLSMFYTGWSLYQEREAFSRERVPLIGHCPVWLATLGAIVQLAIGALLTVGLYTQVAALLAAVVALKCIIWWRRYKKIIPLPPSASLLLLAICLCLVVSGAGAFAFDLPL